MMIPPVIVWNLYRREDHTIDLVRAFQECFAGYGSNANKALEYLEAIEKLHPIRSRQVASVALLNAFMLMKIGV